ncbi:hypothetical protein P7K49_025442 [Saguinus oedipus]|uniref:Uncharacterized protein n=1 Tax=Saguinus oedipus TaxID=9490 RepID=A0ABQ9UH66_SAGOE|nr:hypothetical protein P7K49_025442 [Saguinus oedipus]
MASLRNANPRLKNYFKENYIPQVCEVLDTRVADSDRRGELEGGGVREDFPKEGLSGLGEEWREGGAECQKVKSNWDLWALWLKMQMREKTEVGGSCMWEVVDISQAE